ncbi:Yip1 domain protein [uncultured archaeon]|nr:Yip1 domain protein [uncultured archaeon]
MVFAKDVSRSFRLLLRPSKESSGKMKLVDSLKFYYSASLIPLLLIMVVAFLRINYGPHINFIKLFPMAYSTSVTMGVGAVVVALALLYVWVLVPIGFFIDAAIYQVVGKNFLRLFKGSFENSFSAVTLGSMPMVLLGWLILVPGVNVLAFAVLPVWSLVVLIIALSAQQKITRLQAIGTMVVTAFLAFMTVMLLIYGALLGSGALYSYMLG